MPPWTPSTTPFRVQPPPGLLRVFQHLYVRLIKIFISFPNLRSLQAYFCTPNPHFFAKLVAAFKNSLRQILQRTIGIKGGDKKGRDKERNGNANTFDATNDMVTFDRDRISDDLESLEPKEHKIDLEARPALLNTIANVVLEDESEAIPVGGRSTILEEMPIVDEPELIKREKEVLGAQALEESIHSDCTQQTVKIKKKALLIGIKKLHADSQEVAVLNGPHRDVADMRSLLEDVYGYDPQDIVSLIDNDEPGDIQPTKENILLQISKLVEDARENDRFFFHFAGHCTQEDTDDKEEEDGKNEFIATSDNQTIMDNELRERLVDPLPLKSSLIAVFDTCHSCSLLDLPHFRCNRIYVPWVNKGNRRTDTLWAANQRKLELPTHSLPEGIASPTLRERALTGQLLRQRNTIISSEFDQARAEGRHPSGSRPQLLYVQTGAQSEPELVPGSFLGERHYEDAVDSPVSIFCDGNCRKSPIWNQKRDSEPKPDVICLSSSKDNQVTWEDPLGNSMTRCLVDMLRENPKRSLKEVLSHVSHSIYNRYVDLHDQARGYKKKVKIINLKRKRNGMDELKGKDVEMHNFQDPQISSPHPLDMDRCFEP